MLVRALREASDSTLQRIARLVEEAQAARAPTEQFVYRFSRVYTPLVMAVAVVVAIVPALLGASFGEWFYRARLLPEQKVEAVRELVSKYENVGMVGDGVNDAPALAASSVGFAMGAAGTDVALETADVALMQDHLPKLGEAVVLSSAAERIIKQNVYVSLLIKGLFVLLAPAGLVTLWLAVLADMGTSIAVTLNGLRLFRRGRA